MSNKKISNASSVQAKAASASPKKDVKENSGLRSWTDLERRVFVVYGHGTCEAKKLLSGEMRDNFWVSAFDAAGRKLILQVWGAHANVVAAAIRKIASSDGVLFVIPDVKEAGNGLLFRQKKCNDYQTRIYNAEYLLNLEAGPPEGPKAPFTKFTVGSVIGTFAWVDDAYELNGVKLRHFTQWNVPPSASSPDVDDFDLAEQTYDDASPKKKQRVDKRSTVEPSASISSGSKINLDLED